MLKWKKGVSIVLACLSVMSLTACQGKTEETESEGSQKTELVVWARASSADNMVTTTMEEFNESQDKIHVTVECYGDNYSEVLKLASNSGDLPDIFEVNGVTDIQTFFSTGTALPLNDYLSDEVKAEYDPGAFEVFNVGGNVYGIPHQKQYIRAYYNKDLFEKAGLDPDNFPATLEGMYDAAKAITEAGKGEFYGFGLAMKSGSTWERNIDNIAILSGLTGPHAFDYTTGKFDFAKQKPIIKYFADMYKEGLVLPGSESMDVEVLRANFLSNKIGIYFDGNWMVNGYNNEIEGGKDTNWDSALLPVFEGTERAKDYMMVDIGFSIGANCEHPEEAFEAMSYYLHNLHSAPARKDPSKIAPAFTLIDAVNQEVNSAPEISELKGIDGVLEEEENLAPFSTLPHKVLTLENDSREDVYPLLLMEYDKMDVDAELERLSNTYNSALETAVEEGKLNEENLKPEGFDYYTR